MHGRPLRSLEVCAGAGGQALGLEQAGYKHVGLLELDAHACRTLKRNRRMWPVIRADLRQFSAERLRGRVDLLAGGVPCPPFSVAGKQLGADDDRDLFPQMVRLAEECRPNAVLVENVPGLIKPVFEEYRTETVRALEEIGYAVQPWTVLNASDFGAPQLRPRVVLVALLPEFAKLYESPTPALSSPVTVGTALRDEMASLGWDGADAWAKQAQSVAPTLVGGSKKHGGPDLGPTRAKAAWAKLGVNAHTIAETPPGPGFDGMPRLTVKMCGLIQGFDPDWEFTGLKTNAYRQVGNAFPPPVAKAVGLAIASALGVKADEAAA